MSPLEGDIPDDVHIGYTVPAEEVREKALFTET
jgi:hypothetical protein